MSWQSLRFLAAKVELGLLIALLVVNLLDAVFFQVGSIDSLSIIIRHISRFACLSNGVVMLVDKTD